jgi:N-acetylglucosamine repressor
MIKRYDQKYLKSRNISQILLLLKNEGPKSRAQISRDIGLVKSTVSEITAELKLKNVIFEGKKLAGSLGKRPTLIYFNKDYYYFLAIVITTGEINLAVCNLSGEIIEEKKVILPERIIAKEIISMAFSSMEELIKKYDKKKIYLISLGSPETLNLSTGKIEWSPYIQDWVGLDIGSVFREKFEINVIVKDHVKLETLGEQWKDYGSVLNMIYLTITKGIGAGIVIDGKIREGKDGYLGEVAFIPLSENLNYEEIVHSNKNLGYFESRCDIKKITNLAVDFCRENNINIDFENFDSLAGLYLENKEFENSIDAGILRTLALGLSTMIIVLNPEIVIINGEIIKLGKKFLEKIRNEVFKIMPYQTNIVFSSLKERSRIFGAIKHGLDVIDLSITNDPVSFYLTEIV